MTAYDQFAYTGRTFFQTHPRRLQSVARLFGLEAPVLDTCSVLELGCGDGANLIPMAFHLPNARFVGVDLAAVPVEKGQQCIERLGLGNIQLLQGDVSQIGTSLGKFDYILGHGLYSWVPPFVREAILALIQSALSERGVAYLSYNALPGCRLRHLPRDMLHFRFGKQLQDPNILPQARDFLAAYGDLVVDDADDAPAGASMRTQYPQTLKSEIDFALSLPDYVLFHDDLSEFATPLYLHEFASAAGAHQLQYLGESGIETMFPRAGSESFTAAADEWVPDATDPWVARQQFLDFAMGRRFKQSLLCRASVAGDEAPEGLALERNVGPHTLLGMHVRSSLQAVEPVTDVQLMNREVLTFHFEGQKVAVDEPVAKVTLHRLSRFFPDTCPVAELIASSFRSCREAGLEYQELPVAQGLARLIWSLLLAKRVEILAEPSRLSALRGPDGLPLSDADLLKCRPCLSGYFVEAIQQGLPLTGGLHTEIELDDQRSRDIALSLNGESTVAALGAAAEQGRAMQFVRFLDRHGALMKPAV